jgi:ATP-binding cassette subfamily F protein 3
MISANKVSFSYGYEPVLQNVTFAIPKGKKVGIVGPNGAGKSTLLKLLTKQEYPADGKITISGQLGYVPQEVKKDPLLSSAKTIYDYIDPTGIAGQFAITKVLDGLEFDWKKVTATPSEMSGGQKTKLALARAFLSKPDILLLDEPTNFLDEAGKKWVMHFLQHYPKTVLIVSHDLPLLDQHIQQVLYVNPQTRTVDVYTGNYSKFMRTKQQQDEFLVRQVETTQKKIGQLQKSVDKLKQETSDKKIRQRVVMERRIQRIQDALPTAPTELRKISVSFPPPTKVGSVPLSARGLSKSFQGKRIIHNLDLIIERGERIALIGPNGVGKSTLIKMLTGALTPDSGTVEASENLNLGYYSQEFQTFDENKTLEEVVRETNRLEAHRVYPFLSRFLFPHSRLNQRISTLSGGEKTRLSIALLMLQQHNLLILDEPTTYLDVMSQRIILEALKDYTGAMIVVSHTKEFIQELLPQRALLLPQQKLLYWDDALLERVVEM